MNDETTVGDVQQSEDRQIPSGFHFCDELKVAAEITAVTAKITAITAKITAVTAVTTYHASEKNDK
jgi:hypothetical protein